MSCKKHGGMIKKIIDIIKGEGYRVVRLDKRAIPDAFYIDDDGEPVAIEIYKDLSKTVCQTF